jgi:hypothetical protein
MTRDTLFAWAFLKSAKNQEGLGAATGSPGARLQGLTEKLWSGDKARVWEAI